MKEKTENTEAAKEHGASAYSRSLQTPLLLTADIHYTPLWLPSEPILLADQHALSLLRD